MPQTTNKPIKNVLRFIYAPLYPVTRTFCAIKRRTAARQFSSRSTASNCFGLSCFDRATVLLRFRQQRSEGGKIVAGLLVVGRRLGLVEYGENGRPVRRRNGGRPDHAGVADGGADQAGVSWLHARGNPSQVAAYHFRPGDEHFRQAFHAHRRAPRRRELIQKRERGLD